MNTGTFAPSNPELFHGFSTTDVNECEEYGTCPQDCKNTKGSYECFCAEGFVSFGEPHGTECAAQGKTNSPVPGNVLFIDLLIAFASLSLLYRKPSSSAPAGQRSHSPLQPLLSPVFGLCGQRRAYPGLRLPLGSRGTRTQ